MGDMEALRGGHGAMPPPPKKKLVGATMPLAPPIIGLFIRYF